jgi:hypothetical protein
MSSETIFGHTLCFLINTLTHHQTAISVPDPIANVVSFASPLCAPDHLPHHCVPARHLPHGRCDVRGLPHRALHRLQLGPFPHQLHVVPRGRVPKQHRAVGLRDVQHGEVELAGPQCVQGLQVKPRLEALHTVMHATKQMPTRKGDCNPTSSPHSLSLPPPPSTLPFHCEPAPASTRTRTRSA